MKFATGLAMINNDLVRMFSLLYKVNETGDRGWSIDYRLLTAFTMRRLSSSSLTCRHHNEIEDLLSRLPDETRQNLDELLDGISLSPPPTPQADLRMVMHYPIAVKDAFAGGGGSRWRLPQVVPLN